MYPTPVSEQTSMPRVSLQATRWRDRSPCHYPTLQLTVPTERNGLVVGTVSFLRTAMPCGFGMSNSESIGRTYAAFSKTASPRALALPPEGFFVRPKCKTVCVLCGRGEGIPQSPTRMWTSCVTCCPNCTFEARVCVCVCRVAKR